jgi:predicted transcriptional regulator
MGRRGNKRRTDPTTPTLRELEVYELLARGDRTQREVGEVVGISHSRVSTIYHKLNEWYRIELMHSIRSIKAAHNEHLMHIFRELMCSWYRSQKPGVEEVDEELLSSTGNATKRRTKTVYRDGNPNYLQLAIQCLREIREFTGAGVPPSTAEIDNQSPEEGVGTWMPGEPRQTAINREIERLQGVIDAIEPEAN